MKYSSTSPSTRPAASTFEGLSAPPFSARQPHAQHRRFHDGADIEPVLLRDAGMGEAVLSFRRSLQLGVALVSGKRIAAGRHELHHRSKPSRSNP